MYSHSFQDKELKLHRIVEDSPGQVVKGLTILPYPRGVTNKGLITQKTWIRRAFAQFSRWRVETSQNRRRLLGTGRGWVDDSTVPPRGRKWRVNHSKNLNSTCIRTVFKIKNWNFTGTSTTPRDRLWRGWRFYRTPEGSEIKGWSLKKPEFDVYSHSFQDKELKLHRIVEDSPGQVVKGLTILPYPRGVRNKGLITQKTWIRRVFAQFSR